VGIRATREPSSRIPVQSNARAETIATSNTYREPYKKRRCIIPASGLYEWKKLDAKNRQPIAFDLSNGTMMGIAGLWDAWKDSSPAGRHKTVRRPRKCASPAYCSTNDSNSWSKRLHIARCLVTSTGPISGNS
jgi:hypothetical protein